MKETEYPYDALLDLPHPTSKKHPRMAPIARAAQFAPFAALTGHDAAISETERQVDARPILSEDRLQELNKKIAYLQSCISENPKIIIRYFQPDAKKNGGISLTKTGILKKIDVYSKTMVLADHTMLSLEDILDIDSPLLKE